MRNSVPRLLLIATLGVACGRLPSGGGGSGTGDRMKVLISEAPPGIEVRLYADVEQVEPPLDSYAVFVDTAQEVHDEMQDELADAQWLELLDWSPVPVVPTDSTGGEPPAEARATLTIGGREFGFNRSVDSRIIWLSDELRGLQYGPQLDPFCHWYSEP